MKQRISIFYANGESNNPLRHLMAAALILCLIFTIAFPTATFAADNTGGSDGDRGDGAGNESLEDTVVVQDLHSEPQSRRAVEERIHLYEGGAFTFNDGYTLGVYRSDDPSIQLTQGNDYDVTYANNTGSGTMTVTITGKGAYTGEITKQVQIAPITSIQINDAAFSNTKNPPLPELSRLW